MLRTNVDSEREPTSGRAIRSFHTYAFASAEYSVLCSLPVEARNKSPAFSKCELFYFQVEEPFLVLIPMSWVELLRSAAE